MLWIINVTACKIRAAGRMYFTTTATWQKIFVFLSSPFQTVMTYPSQRGRPSFPSILILPWEKAILEKHEFKYGVGNHDKSLKVLCFRGRVITMFETSTQWYWVMFASLRKGTSQWNVKRDKNKHSQHYEISYYYIT